MKINIAWGPPNYEIIAWGPPNYEIEALISLHQVKE
jgi:hypothetical protein